MKKESTRRGRFYETPDGERYPSVTTILSVIGKPALMVWAANVERELVTAASASLYQDSHGTPQMSRSGWLTTLQARLGTERAHQKELNKAGDIGSQIHALIEWELQSKMLEKAGPSPHVTDAAMWGYMAWQDWAKSVNLKPLAIEQAVWSRTHGYAGTLDLLAEVNGELTVLDWKSGKAVYPEAHLQNAAYRHAIREMGHGDPVKGIIVRVPKVVTDPNFEAVEADPEAESLEIFLNAKKLWEWNQRKDTYLAKQETERHEPTTLVTGRASSRTPLRSRDEQRCSQARRHDCDRTPCSSVLEASRAKHDGRDCTVDEHRAGEHQPEDETLGRSRTGAAHD